MAAQPVVLAARHIQNFSDATTLQPHWGYEVRALPCTNDPGSCEYLDLVYGSHDRGILYSGILWATVGGILFLITIAKRLGRRSEMLAGPLSGGSPNEQHGGELQAASPTPRGFWDRLGSTVAAGSRRYLLPESFLRSVFGRTTRLQLLILAVFAGYLLIWSFVGIAYRKWITPVKNMPGVYNTRTSLGPWADRVGTLAFALMPFSILLANRESVLSLLTGIPYHHFNFLHRWLGHIIFIQSSLHTIGWCVIEIRLYQPQPQEASQWIRQKYMVWGVVAMGLLLLLWVLSMPISIRYTGYEFFRKAHYVLAIVFLGACWGHWKQLEAFLIPAMTLWFLDRAVRLVRTALLHYNYLPDGSMGFSAAQAEMTRFEDADNGDVLRLDFVHPQQPWQVGQHFYLCFTEGSIWQSHPFTPLSYPQLQSGVTRHSYIARAKKGETKKMVDLAARKIAEFGSNVTTPVILTGPYGTSIVEDLSPESNVLCVAGGTGITFVLPVLLHLGRNGLLLGSRSVQLIWVVRKGGDVDWCKPELDELRRYPQIRINIFVTRQQGQRTDDEAAEKASISTPSQHSDSCCSDAALEKATTTATPGSAPLAPVALLYTAGSTPEDRHPDLAALVAEFVESTVRGPTTVFASGPGGMITSLRSTVASHNDAMRVWKGQERYDVRFVSDNRLEW